MNNKWESGKILFTEFSKRGNVLKYKSFQKDRYLRNGRGEKTFFFDL